MEVLESSPFEVASFVMSKLMNIPAWFDCVIRQWERLGFLTDTQMH